MHAIWLTWQNEWMLMRLRKKTTRFMVLSACLPILFALVYHTLQKSMGVFGLTVSFPVMLLSLYTIFWIPLFIFMTTADLFPGETAARTLKLTLLRPITRFQAFTGKMMAAATAMGFLFVMLFFVSMACTYVESRTVDLSVGDWFGYMKAYLAAFFVMLALFALFAWIAQWFQNPTGYMVFAILLYVAAKALPFFSSVFSAFSLTSYSDWYVLWLSHSTGFTTLMNTFLFIFSWFVLFFSLGYLMFDRKEA
ncbi:ABC transporter permease subunit [Gorillibacterium massiliense]|uniref:ABC transporter permease subunit n=1 Tax=Gorillibacterium massiliense TaxID=1280390 RepID=UPI0004B28358|nr:ABC transporter permease subunit [Gorillibacterium massiliense]